MTSWSPPDLARPLGIEETCGCVRGICLQTARVLKRADVGPVDPIEPQMSKELFGLFGAAERDLVMLSLLVRRMDAPEPSARSVAMPEIVQDEHA